MLLSHYLDYLGVHDNPEIKALLSQNGDTEVVFSDLVNKINKRLKSQERALIASEKALYNMEKLNKKKGNQFSVKRRIPFDI